ncbi:hypothetical protein WR25_26782 isoform C [Diploscapter pachys]|uniref:Uncharacterized protein n=1 Tax=Diploscapter pachys TaxID=2018661 RepID=A0A2A2KSH2_9BILA|nr:hypothetical protein WR25_26782 isoform C [Diploscapter pachys]
MDAVRDVEIPFSDGFARKAARTLLVNSNAPLHSSKRSVASSSGISVFPHSPQFADRFIVWRAIGQKLYLEERSTKYSVIGGAICFDFCRTSVLSGTSIEISDDAILCIVVPTQSTTHRFYVRLNPERANPTSQEVNSFLDQIVEKDIHAEYHTAYQLSTNGHPIRASVIQQGATTKVAYCMEEGSLVVVNLGAYGENDHTECVLKDGGIIKLIMGKSSASERVADVAGLNKGSSAGHLQHTFYAIYCDSTLKAWNADKRTNYYLTLSDSAELSMHRNGASEDRGDQELRYLVRCRRLTDRLSLVVAAVNTNSRTRFHFIQDNGSSLNAIGSFDTQNNEQLIDFGIVNEEDALIRLWAVWGTPNMANDYSMKSVYVHPNPDSNSPSALAASRGIVIGVWRPVSLAPKWRGLSAKLSSSELHDMIFNIDAHPFDVVHRAVQVTCDGFPCEVEHGDWWGLVKHAETYKSTAEFDAKYKQRSRSNMLTQAVVSGVDVQKEAEHRFYQKLASCCLQFEEGSTCPIGLGFIDEEDISIAALIFQDRFCVLQDADFALSAALVDCNEAPLVSAIEESRRKTVNSDDTDSSSDSEDLSAGASLSLASASAISNGITKDALHLARSFIKTDNSMIRQASRTGHEQQPMDTEEEAENTSMEIDVVPPKPSRSKWTGSFVRSLLAASLRIDVSRRIRFCVTMIKFFEALEKSPRIKPQLLSEFPEVISQLKNYYIGLKKVDDQLKMIMPKAGPRMCVASWIFSHSDPLDLLVAQAEKRGRTAELHDLGQFISAVVDVAIACLWPTSPLLCIPMLMAKHEMYTALKSICETALDAPPELQSAWRFYSAIAYSGIGQPMKAMNAFLEASHGINQDGLQNALAMWIAQGAQVPHQAQPVQLAQYFIVAIRILQEHNHGQEVIDMASKALGHLKGNTDTVCKSRIQSTLFKQLISKAKWADALEVVRHVEPADRRIFMDELLTCMIRVKQWKTITETDFGEMTKEVEDFLWTRARAQDVNAEPHLYDLLYNICISRKDYRTAAMVHYEFAQHLAAAVQSNEILEKRFGYLGFVLNSFEQIEFEDDRYIIFPEIVYVTDPVTGETQEKQRTAVLREEDIYREFVLADARCALVRFGTPSSDPREILENLLENKLFDGAFDICKYFSLSFFDMIHAVTVAAIDVTVDAEYDPRKAFVQQPTWIRNNRRHLRVDCAEENDAWWMVHSYMRDICLETPCDSRPFRAAVTALLSYGQTIPKWLNDDYFEHDAADYLRCLVDYGKITEGMQLAVQLIDREMAKVIF